MLDDLASLSAKLEIERQAITALVQPLQASDLNRPGPDGCWSIRQTLSHIIASEAGLLALARAIAAGECPQRPHGYDLNQANAREVSRRQTLTLPSLLAQWQENRDQWAGFLESLSQEQLKLAGAHPGFEQQITLIQLVIVMLKHERNHKQEIARMLPQL